MAIRKVSRPIISLRAARPAPGGPVKRLRQSPPIPTQPLVIRQEKIAPLEGSFAKDFSFPDLVYRIILGPSQSGPLVLLTVRRMLVQPGRARAWRCDDVGMELVPVAELRTPATRGLDAERLRSLLGGMAARRRVRLSPR